MSKSKITISVDDAIEHYNEKNPDKRQMSRDSLIEKLDSKLTKETIRNWGNGNIPKAFINLSDIMAETGCELSDLLTIERDGKKIF